jgi:competence ComEA-like helix-hairpin-helix protein
LYDKAVALGLEPIAMDVLIGKTIHFEKYVKKSTEGLKTVEDIKKGTKDILIHVIVKNKEVLEEIRSIKNNFNIKIEVTATKAAKDDKNAYKFQNYFNFSSLINYLKPHQTLAIFRGENLKLLKVSFTFDERFTKNIYNFAKKVLLTRSTHESLFSEAFQAGFSKRISPFLIRQIRADLQKSADKASIASFTDNLKNLLLTMPVKGKKILGIDPGFKHGCKMALIAENGAVITTTTIYPFENFNKSSKELIEILENNKCELIALGNGTACRETEEFLSKVLKNLTNIQYCIVSEQGASIYSCSDEARKEFHDKYDTNVISAISISRRLQDPLSELVKIEPKNLGVGMYQHDVDEKLLSSALLSVVSECVSCVGIDINCASLSILKHISGLTEKRAMAILDYKNKNGNFKSREELMKVKSIGAKTYTQMVGFVKVFKETAGCDDVDLLDATTIHPESYDLVKMILKSCKLEMKNFGDENFQGKIKKFCEENSIEVLVKKFKESPDKIESVLNTLKKESPFFDFRCETNFQPVFKRGIQKISDLKKNQVVTGVVRNIVDFGAFIDIGIQQDGLLHKSKMKNLVLKLGDRIECKIESVSENGKRIALTI